jgi:hypothetical protein
MPSDRDRRLLALEARLPPSEPVIKDADLRKRLQFVHYLAGGPRPKESVGEAIGRLLGIAPGCLLPAMRSGDFADRWEELMRPLRGLEGPAFAAACEEIRRRCVDSNPYTA